MELFGLDNSRPDNRTAHCKVCRNARYQPRYKDEISKQKRSLRRKKNRKRETELALKYRRENINEKLRCNLRSRLHKALKGDYKRGSAVSDLGCSVSKFRTYMETKFNDGMTWENYGEWHIDHIQPLASFDLTDRDQLLKACNYNNLQPLWARDNYKKSNKY